MMQIPLINSNKNCLYLNMEILSSIGEFFLSIQTFKGCDLTLCDDYELYMFYKEFP